MSRASPRVATVPASAPFLETVIRALLDGRLVPGFTLRDDPLALADVTIYLPTRRAGALARAAFLDVLGDAALLPRLAALGDLDEDEFIFADAASGALALELPPALDGLERRLSLARLVQRWAREEGGSDAQAIAGTPAAALALADELARLRDDMITRKVPWEKLDQLAPAELDEQWQKTHACLGFVRREWPKVLADRGAMEPAERRDVMLAREAERLARRASGPVIAAGSTASMPSTAALLEAVARLPHGAVVLPGLDTDLEPEAWDLLRPEDAGTGGRFHPAGHPQFGMYAFLQRLQMTRDDVLVLAAPAPHGREKLLSEALRPAETTEVWAQREAEAALAGLDGLTVIEAAGAEEEALAIAVAVREALEQPGARIGVVTPDRALARRVASALGRWGISVADSGGEPLRDAPEAIVARLAAEVALGGAAPVPLLALLKHPLVHLLANPEQQARATSALERALLRGPRPRSGTSGLTEALRTFRATQEELHHRDARRRIQAWELDLAEDVLARLTAAIAPLEGLAKSACGFAELAAQHRIVIAALGGAAHDIDVLASPAGEALEAVLDTLAARSPGDDFTIGARDYRDLFELTVDGAVVRPRTDSDAPVQILGLLEARLQRFDRVVLGGLVEGVWPPQPRLDPWLSRPMRIELGVDLPERRIGLTAHDFAQLLGAREVILTRAAKVGGAPTVSSRFVQRLAAVTGPKRWKHVVARGDHYVAMARMLDEPARVDRLEAPRPTPPRTARPRQLSVTEVEAWLRDPYEIYAKRVLGLSELDAVDTPPGARDRGTSIHGAVEEFTRTLVQGWPDRADDLLIALGRKHFAKLADYPEAQAFWWPRFLRAAQWFIRWEQERRASVSATLAELRGALEIPLEEGTFRLTAAADRVDRLADGAYAIIDYKTGGVPSESDVKRGLKPQLTLEAAILRGGGFPDIAAGASVAELLYVGLKGGDPGGSAEERACKQTTPDAEADKALARLTDLLRGFDNDTQPYPSIVRAERYGHLSAYHHLARVKEFSATGGAEVDVDNG